MKIVKDGTTIQSLDIGLRVLNLIATSDTPLRFVDIQEKTQMTKSNLYKYLNTLLISGVVTKSEESGFYYTGPKLIEYGVEAIANQDVHEIISPYLHKLGAQLNTSILFAIATFNGPVITKIWSPNQSINIGAQLGTILPPQSSSGKIFRIFYENEISPMWFEQSYELSEEEQKEISEKKVAFSKEPLIKSVSSFSAPILSFNKELIGTLIAVGFSDQIPNSVDDERTELFLNVQQSISKQFGYHSK